MHRLTVRETIAKYYEDISVLQSACVKLRTTTDNVLQEGHLFIPRSYKIYDTTSDEFLGPQENRMPLDPLFSSILRSGVPTCVTVEANLRMPLGFL